MSGFEEFMDNLRERTFMCYPGIGSNSFKYDYSHVEQAYQAGRADRQQQDVQIAMDAASHSVADIAKAQSISDLIAEAK